MGIEQHWPLFDLRVATPRLELRVPRDDEIDEIAEIAERSVTEGIHDPATMPFTVEWTDVPAPRRQRETLQYHWGLRARWRPDDWELNMVVVEEDRIVGCQSVGAKDFGLLRTGTTGSFLFLPAHGRGLGTEMRSAILHLLFGALEAQHALTSAFDDNASSIGVTRKLGYERDGTQQVISRGRVRQQLRFRLSRDRWMPGRRYDIEITGFEACSEMFGVG